MVVDILLITVVSVYCCKRVPLYAKTLKETENGRNNTFLSLFFLILFRFDRSGPLGPSFPGYAYDCYFNAICDIKILIASLRARS